MNIISEIKKLEKLAKRKFTEAEIAASLNRSDRGFTEDDLQSEAQDLADFLNSFDSSIELYRVVHAESKKSIDLKRIGEHWTHSKQKALEFARGNLSKPWFLITGTVSHSDVDWAQTIFQNVHHPHEEELNIPSWSKIKNVKVVPIK